jgi:hypothetical protein
MVLGVTLLWVLDLLRPNLAPGLKQILRLNLLFTTTLMHFSIIATIYVFNSMLFFLRLSNHFAIITIPISHLLSLVHLGMSMLVLLTLVSKHCFLCLVLVALVFVPASEMVHDYHDLSLDHLIFNLIMISSTLLLIFISLLVI